MVYFRLVDGIDNLLENDFFAESDLAQRNRVFMNIRFQTLEKLTDELLFNIKVANSIYPQCMAEWQERRVSMGKAIGSCYAILTNLQRVMIRLRIPDNKYTEDIKNIERMINSLKAWRKSDNKLKSKLEN